MQDPGPDSGSRPCIIESKGSTNVIFIYFEKTTPIKKAYRKQKKKPLGVPWDLYVAAAAPKIKANQSCQTNAKPEVLNQGREQD